MNKRDSEATKMPQIRIRAAEPADSLLILAWRNDPLVCAMSRSDETIDQASHCAWYANAMESPDKVLLVGLFDDCPAGVVRFDREDTATWEVSIFLAPEARGKGGSRGLLHEAIRHFYTTHQGASLTAQVKPCNAPSLRLFASLGFEKVKSDGNLVYFHLPCDAEICSPD